MKLFHQTKAENVIIVGCGLLGSALAAKFTGKSSHVTLIDCDSNSFSALRDNCGEELQGDGTDVETLLQAQIQTCDIFFAVTGDDNTNLMAAQLAKAYFEVKNVFARVDDVSKEFAYAQIGITAFSSPLLLCREFQKVLERSEVTV